jgi:hypothetical protein
MKRGEKNYKLIEEFIRNNKEIQKLELKEIINIWRGSRAMTYDIIPFISKVEGDKKKVFDNSFFITLITTVIFLLTVFTFLHPDAVPAIEQFLFRKDISVPVIYYKTVEDLEYDLRFKRAIRTIFVPHKEQASVLGMRATVTPPTSAWVL